MREFGILRRASALLQLHNRIIIINNATQIALIPIEFLIVTCSFKNYFQADSLNISLFGTRIKKAKKNRTFITTENHKYQSTPVVATRIRTASSLSYRDIKIQSLHELISSDHSPDIFQDSGYIHLVNKILNVT